MKGLTMRINR